VLFLHLQRDRVYEITIPSKTYGYLASGRPILAAAEGELAHLIKEYCAGVVCPPEDGAALAQAIRKLRAMPVSQLEQMGRAGCQAVSTHFSRMTLGKRYSMVFENAVKTFQEKKN
jgi:glycosyltransferase involved in cell wall biosynthesis